MVLLHERLEVLQGQVLRTSLRTWHRLEEQRLVDVERELLDNQVVRSIEPVQLLELRLIVLIGKLLFVFQHGLAHHDAGDYGHVFEGLEQLRRAVVYAASLRALHELEEEVGFDGLAASAIENVIDLNLGEVVASPRAICEKELLREHFLELRQVDAANPVVRLLQLFLGHLVIHGALLQYGLYELHDVDLGHLQSRLEVLVLLEDVLCLPQPLFNDLRAVRIQSNLPLALFLSRWVIARIGATKSYQKHLISVLIYALIIFVIVMFIFMQTALFLLYSVGETIN